MLRGGRGRGSTRALAVVALSLAILGLLVQSAWAEELREVSPDGSNAVGNLCRLYETPCATIQHAIDIAESGDEVFVRPGVYAEDLTIDKPLELTGRYGAQSPGEPQSTVAGDSGTAIAVESDDVAIKGIMATAGAGGTAIRADAADLDNFVVQEDIISGGSAGLRLEAGGEGDSIGYNLIEGVGDGIELNGAAYAGLKIQWNRFVAPVTGYTVLANGGTTIKGLRLEGNEMPAPTRIAARIDRPSNEENWIEENSFSSTTGPQLAIDGEGLRFNRNTFEGHGSASCLQILGNQGGLAPSTGVLFDGDNAFIDCAPFGIELGPEVDDVGIYRSDFPGTYDGIVTSSAAPWDVTGHVQIRWNRFVGTGHLGVANLASGTLDAEQNWWGCNAGPGVAGCDRVSSGVDAGNPIEVGLRIGPLKKETGIIELPIGDTITLNPGERAEVAAEILVDGQEFNPGGPIYQAPVGFSSPLGSLSPVSSHLSNGWTRAVFIAGETPGQGWITASMDNQRTVIPVTICCTTSAPPATPTVPMPQIETPPSPTTTPVQKPHAPTLVGVTRKRHALAGRWATVGTISCDDSCQVASGPAWIDIGRHRYRGMVAPRGTLGAGSTTPIRVALPRPARQALRKLGSARVRVTETVVDAEGQSVTRTVSEKIIE